MSEPLVRFGLGDVIRKLRGDETQIQLARRAGVDPGALVYLEREQRNTDLQTIKKLAAALNVPLADLWECVDQLTWIDLLSPAATAALEEFARWECWGKFSQSAMHSAVQRACKAVGVPRFTPYAIRHLFAYQVYKLTGDLSTVARLLGHADLKTTKRYAASAFEDVDRAVVERVGELSQEPEKSS